MLGRRHRRRARPQLRPACLAQTPHGPAHVTPAFPAAHGHVRARLQPSPPTAQRLPSFLDERPDALQREVLTDLLREAVVVAEDRFE